MFISDCFKKMDGFDQKNPYHNMDLGTHCKFTYEKFISMENMQIRNMHLLQEFKILEKYLHRNLMIMELDIIINMKVLDVTIY